MFDSYADIFAERAQSYHHAMQCYPTARAAEFLAVLEPISGKSGSLCDLPGGGGYLADWLLPKWTYTAVEPTESFGAMCRANGRAVTIGSMNNVPFGSSTFDAVVSLAGLHHEQDKGAILAEVQRILRDDGTAVIADVAEGSNEDSFLNGYVDSRSVLGHKGLFLDTTFSDLIMLAGLRVRKDEIVTVPWRFKNRRESALFARSLFGISAEPEEIEGELAQSIGFEDVDGGCVLLWRLRRVVCTR